MWSSKGHFLGDTEKERANPRRHQRGDFRAKEPQARTYWPEPKRPGRPTGPRQEPQPLCHQHEHLGGPPKGRHCRGDTKRERPNPRRYQGNIAKAIRRPQGRTSRNQDGQGSGRIFSTTLNYSTTEEDVETLLGKLRPLTETNLPIDQLTGKRKGFAFVTFATPAHAAAAISAVEGKGLQGRRLHLIHARSKTHQEYAANARKPQGTSLRSRETPTTADPQQDGPCECPLNAGETRCSAKKQGRTCHCHAEGCLAGSRLRPSSTLPGHTEHNRNPKNCKCTLLNPCTLACN